MVPTRKAMVAYFFATPRKFIIAFSLLCDQQNILSSLTDVEEEKIDIAKAAVISLPDLPSQVPSDQARYHLYIFKHTHEGDPMESVGKYSNDRL